MSNSHPINPSSFHDYQRAKLDLNKSEIGFWDYLNYRGDFELAVAFGKLFWPEFVEQEGCVLLAESYDPESFEQLKRSLNGDCRKIEAMINHVHIYDLFLNTNSDAVVPEIFEYLGRMLRKFWELALLEAYPDRHFKIQYASDPEDYGPTVTFYQED